MSTIRRLLKRAALNANPHRFGGLLAALLISLLLGPSARAQSNVTLTWSASDDDSVAGYRVYWGCSSRVYTNSVDVEDETSYKFTSLIPGVTYYFAVTAYDIYGDESPFSDEVLYTVPVPSQPPPVAVTFGADSGTVTAPFMVSDSFVWQSIATSPPGGGSATYSFMLASGGNYTLSALTETAKGESGSFYVNIDADPTDSSMIWDIAPSGGLVSRTVTWRGMGSVSAPQFVPKVFTLSAGPHQLNVAGRGANTKLGAITIAPYLAITSCSKLPTGNFSIGGIGASYQSYALLSATSLTLPILWTPIATNIADAQGLFTCTDLWATNYASRFYRVRLNVAVATSVLITSCHPLADGSFSVAGTASANQTCVLQAASSPAGPVAWTPIATNVADGYGVFGFEDSQAGNYACRFYRVLGR